MGITVHQLVPLWPLSKERRIRSPTGHEQYNFFLAVCFPHNQLKIMDYNRVVKDLNGLSEAEFMKKVEEKFFG